MDLDRRIADHDEIHYRCFVERLGLRFFFYRHDLEGTFTYLSPSITGVLGYTPAEFQKPYSTYLTDHPLNLEVSAFTDLSLQGIKQPAYLVQIRHKDGTLRWLEVEEHPIRDESGRMIAVEGVAQDVTARSNLEASLRESEERLRKIIDFSPISMALVGMDGTIEYINRCAIETFGYLPADIPVMDRWWVQAYPDPVYRAEAIAQWMGLVEKAIGENREIEGRDYRVTCKDGTVKEMFIFGIPVVGRIFVIFQDVTARVLAQEALRVSEERLRTLSDNLADAMVYQTNTGADGSTRTLTYVSAAVEKLHGVTVEEALRNPACIYDQVFEKDRARIAALEAEAIRKGCVFRAEVRFRLPSGEIRWRQFVSSSRQLPNGHLLWDGLEIDITDRKVAEEENRASLLLRDGILASTPAGIILYDQDGQCLVASSAAAAIVGTTVDRLREQNYRQIDSWKASGLIDAAEQCMQTGQATRLVTRHVSTFGKTIWMDSHFTRIELRGQPHLLIMFRDITQEKHLEEARRKAEERYGLLAESLDVGFFHAREGRFLEVNDAVVRMAHYDNREEFLAVPAERLYALPEDRTRMIAKLRENGFIRGHELFSLRKDGSLYWVSISALLERDEEGESVVGFIEDITARKKAEEERGLLLAKEQEARREAEAAVHVRDEFLSVAAHDLKTPLSALQIQVEQMEKAYREQRLQPERIGPGLELVGRQTRRLIRLVRGLLELSRINAGQFALKKAPCDLGLLAKDVLERMTPELDRAECAVNFVATPDVIGHWDQDRLEQIVENLLANAIKFGAGSVVRVEVFSIGHAAILMIADRGIGIPPDQVDRIFEPFERGGVSTHYGGMGMGLYIARRIADAHDGTLTVTSTSGEGSVFSMELPFEEKTC